MQSIPLFYQPEMVAPPHRVSPSPLKPLLMYQRWRNMPEIERMDFGPVSADTLTLAHDPDYVKGVLDGTMENGFGVADAEFAKSLPWTVGSMVSAAIHVMRQVHRTPVACSPTSGFHHAGYSFGTGFCTFNGLIVAARAVIEAGLAKHVAIIDCDYHFGDGTAQIMHKLRLHNHITHWSAGAEYHKRAQATRFFADLANGLRNIAERCDLVLYQAGADAHVDDPLGGFLTSHELYMRDRMVFRTCRDYDMPVVWNLAGGYQKDDMGTPEPVLELHDKTMQACIDIFIRGAEV